MPANTHPSLPGANDDLAIHIECHDGGAPCGCKTDKLAAAAIPGQVFLPLLEAGVKERRPLSGQRIDARGLRTFELVAPAAGETQIVERRLPALNPGQDMIKSEWLAGGGRASLTVGATMIVRFN